MVYIAISGDYVTPLARERKLHWYPGILLLMSSRAVGIVDFWNSNVQYWSVGLRGFFLRSHLGVY